MGALEALTRDPAIGDAARSRRAFLEAGTGDPRPAQVSAVVADPTLQALVGPLRSSFERWTDEKRYVRGPADPGMATEKGKVLVESIRVTVTRDGAVLFDRTYKGDKAKKGESFNPTEPLQGGYRVRINAATVDLFAMGRALLAPLGNGDLKRAATSKSKYISSAASTLLDAPDRAGAAAVPTHHDEEDEDDD